MADHLVRLFFSYDPKDRPLFEDFEKHLATWKRGRPVEVSHSGLSDPGTEWKQQIGERLNAADLILLLVSSDFLAANERWEHEISHALTRAEAGTAKVIPVLLRPVNWRSTSLGPLTPLPANGKPVSDWQNQDHAWSDIIQGLETSIKELQGKVLSRLAAENERLRSELDRRSQESLKLRADNERLAQEVSKERDDRNRSREVPVPVIPVAPVLDAHGLVSVDGQANP